jgi:uncharacterized protein YceH (UPF0502 family)
MIEIDAVEARVLGCLIEKEITTPEYYPMTLNALLNACNQKSNRDPVLTYEEEDIPDALDRLRHKQLLSYIDRWRESRPEVRPSAPGANDPGTARDGAAV